MNDEIIKWITYLTVRHDFYNLPQKSVNAINVKKLLNDIESQTISTVDFMQNPLKFLAAYEIEIDEKKLSQYNAAGSFHKKLLDNNAHHSEFLSQLSKSLHSPDSITSFSNNEQTPTQQNNTAPFSSNENNNDTNDLGVKIGVMVGGVAGLSLNAAANHYRPKKVNADSLDSSKNYNVEIPESRPESSDTEISNMSEHSDQPQSRQEINGKLDTSQLDGKYRTLLVPESDMEKVLTESQLNKEYRPVLQEEGPLDPGPSLASSLEDNNTMSQRLNETNNQISTQKKLEEDDEERKSFDGSREDHFDDF
ncbi:hypothetical protein [Cysteiniphilum halobium]|uniref:hypothetical protein n=1 Tax=Cysteiniphilum halobium TaxID=2219059 RepID=UPI003F82F370